MPLPPCDLEQREPKGWQQHLKEVLMKAKRGVGLAKAFAPHIDLSDPNRVKVGVRIRPLSESEAKKGESKSKDNGYMKIGGTQIRITNPRPPPGQDPKTDNFAFDQLYGPETTTATRILRLGVNQRPSKEPNLHRRRRLKAVSGREPLLTTNFSASNQALHS